MGGGIKKSFLFGREEKSARVEEDRVRKGRWEGKVRWERGVEVYRRDMVGCGWSKVKQWFKLSREGLRAAVLPDQF